jgi:ABC-type multidrug transport system ATPase subunit
MIEIEGLTKRFGDRWALRSLDLRIESGVMFGLLGPNGAGKTTLFRILMGIIRPSAGHLRVAGLDAFGDRIAVKRLLGYLPDEPSFHSYLSAREIFDLSAALHGLDAAQAFSRLKPLIERLQLIEAFELFADDFSRGMKKKLGLLLALLHNPRLLVLDEPTNGLDVESTATFFAVMRDLQAQGTTIVFSTHLLSQVEQLCSHAAIIDQGQLCANGSVAEIAASVPGAATLEQAFIELTKPKRQSPADALRARLGVDRKA